MTEVTGPQFWTLCQEVVNQSATLATLSMQVHDLAHAMQDMAAQMASGLLPAAIEPGMHYDCPTPESVPVAAIASTVAAGGYVLANLADPKKAPAHWVRIVAIDPEANAAVKKDPFWAAQSTLLKKMREAIWEAVLIARQGA